MAKLYVWAIVVLLGLTCLFQSIRITNMKADIRNMERQIAVFNTKVILNGLAYPLQDTAGNWLVLQDISARYVLVVFFRVGDCSICIQAIKEVIERMAGNEIYVSVVVADSSVDEIRQLEQVFGCRVLLDCAGRFFAEFGVHSTPRMFLVNLHQKTVAEQFGPMYTEYEIENVHRRMMSALQQIREQ